MRHTRVSGPFRHVFVLISLALAGATSCAPHAATAPAAGGNAAAPSTDPAVYGVVDRRGKDGASLFVTHQVSDFAAYKKFFDDGSAERDNAGIKGHLLTRLDGGRVVVHLFGSDLQALKMTLDSPSLEQYLNRSGAPDASAVWLAYDELVKLPAQPPAGQTFSLFFRMRMNDLAALRRGFVDLQPLFSEHGVVASGLHHSVNQSDLVFMHFTGTSRDKLESLAKEPRFVDYLATRGVTDPPESFLGEDVSRSRTYFSGFN